MTAVDTNVLVRSLTDDDPKQTAAARLLFTAEQIWIAKTVLLETEWVLRKLYGFDETAIVKSFTRLLGLENVLIEDEPSVGAALSLTAYGIRFADALHISSRPPNTPFVSFDRTFVRRAQRAGATGVAILPDR